MNRYIFSNILLVSCLLWIQNTVYSQGASSDIQSFEHRLVQILDSTHLPGISLTLLRDYKAISHFVSGYSNNQSRELIDTLTVFEAASLTKPLVAYCALKMVELNQLSLDVPLSDYLKYPPIEHDERYHQITARMVLTHSSGFPNWRSNRQLDTLHFRFDPGTRFGYSGEGFVYLQKVMEEISGRDLQMIAQQYVFDPLQMNRSSLVFDYQTNFAVGHDSEHQPVNKFKPQEANAAYSLHTTAMDYARFMMELIKPRNLDFEFSSKMISKQILMKVHEPSLAWGLGVGLNLLRDDSLIWHWGDNGNFKAFFLLSKIHGDGFVYFSNSYHGLSIVKRLIHWVFSDDTVMAHWNEYDQY